MILSFSELGWRRRSVDLGKVTLNSRRSSLSFERESWSIERQRRRSLSLDRRSLSTERQSLSGSRSTSSSQTWTNNSSGYESSTMFNTIDANIPPQFMLPLLDQTLPVGEKCTMIVLGQYARACVCHHALFIKLLYLHFFKSTNILVNEIQILPERNRRAYKICIMVQEPVWMIGYRSVK